MANNIFQIQAKDSILKLNHFDTINAVQSFNWDPAFNEEYLQELGNAAYSEQTINPEVSGSFESNATGSTVAILNRMTQALDNSGAFDGYRFDAANPNTGTLRHTDLEYAVFDLIQCKQANEIFTRSEWFPRAFLTSLAFSADASGSATETYSFEGQLAQVMRSPYHDIVSVPAIRASETTATFSGADGHIRTGALANTTHILRLVQVDEQIIPGSACSIARTSLGADVTAGTDDDEYTLTLSGGYFIPEGSRVMILAYKETPGEFPTVYNPTAARFVRANNIDLWLVDKSEIDISQIADGSLNATVFDDAYDLLRVQSFSMNVDLRREPLRQIKKQAGLSSIFYRATTFPLTITANVSMFESDLLDWVRLQDGNTEPANADDVLDLSQFQGKQKQLVVRYYYNDEVLQTMVLNDARVNSMGHSIAVGGRSQVNWGLTGSDWRIEGSDVTAY